MSVIGRLSRLLSLTKAMCVTVSGYLTMIIVSRLLAYINNKTTTIVAQSDISVVGLIGEREVVT